MKIIPVCSLFLLFFVVSCKKEYTCECTSSSGTYDAGTIDRNTKSSAKKDCKTLSAGETTCTLKN